VRLTKAVFTDCDLAIEPYAVQLAMPHQFQHLDQDGGKLALVRRKGRVEASALGGGYHFKSFHHVQVLVRATITK
jgi:hypothetical protein